MTNHTSKTQHLFRILCLCTVFLFLRCGGCDGTTTGGDPPIDGDMSVGMCLADSTSCVNHTDCCSGTCDPGTNTCSTVMMSCLNFGQACTDNGACCSGICDPNSKTCGQACLPQAATCSVNADCCSGTCDNATKKCTQPIACKPTGSTCTTGAECCGLSCNGGICQATCTSDGMSCTTGGQCCSGLCSGTPMACQPINPGAGCKSSGNGCTVNTDCCSGLCDQTSKTCRAASSFCRQRNDICTQNSDCCEQNCVKPMGSTNGVCQALPVSGAGGCSVAGTLCQQCTCCSALCLAYAGGPTKVCQNPQGCHPTGDLCTKNSDCCGYAGSGLPGDGQVYCEKSVGFAVGVCRKPTGCNPQGNICKYTGTVQACGIARNNCCDQPGGPGSSCKLDAQGVPRCYGINSCRMSGETCSNTADCCNNLACIPDAMGILKCGNMGMKCSPSGGPCSVAADCCTVGDKCITAPGSVQGICTPPSTPDGGTADGGTDGGTALCAEYGQACRVGGTPCCNGVQCSKPGGFGDPCAAGDTDCTCYKPIP